MKVRLKTKNDEKTTLAPSLGGAGGRKSSISNLDELNSKKEKKKIE